jgi:AraC family transcriptional activator of tynA and feaB
MHGCESAISAQWIGCRSKSELSVKTIVSTADVHRRDAFDYWHEMLCKRVVRHDCTPEDRRAFRATIRSSSVADIDLVEYESAPMQNDVTARHIAHANADALLVRRQIAGMFLFEQDGREAVLEAGDITLFDPSRPMRGKYSSGAKQLVLKVPRRQLETRVGDVRQVVARAIKPLEAEQGLTSAYLAMLPTYADGLQAAAAHIVRDQTLDLVAVSLAKAMGWGRPRLSSARSLVLVNVRAAIETRLGDPTLDSRTVAAAAGVSVRYANSVLADDGTSIMRLIRTRRLERCRRALEDPSQSHRTVSEIAYSWGFSDMTHFGRSFRAAFGSLPSEYRARLYRGSGAGCRRDLAEPAR